MDSRFSIRGHDQMMMSPWWSFCTLYLLACQVKVTAGDSGLCYYVCVTSFERKLAPLFVDSAQALWASFCFRLCFSLSLKYAPSVIVLRPTEFTMNPKCMSTSSQERNYDWNLSCFYNSSKHSHRPIISVVLNTKLSYM